MLLITMLYEGTYISLVDGVVGRQALRSLGTVGTPDTGPPVGKLLRPNKWQPQPYLGTTTQRLDCRPDSLDQLNQ